MRREYNRLVRDKVPEIITNSGRKCDFRILSDSEVILALQDKLQEKAEKFAKHPSEEEISDIYELLDAIIDKFGYEQMHIDYLKLKNREETGGYNKNTYLIYVEDDSKE
ncbi:MAG: hypothetical protein ACOYB8_07860 [Eubacteriaceae bacterium]|jgi:predicted house-cleaning noncanonical NTP pyrophosphatase (MazG superfamily)